MPFSESSEDERQCIVPSYMRTSSRFSPRSCSSNAPGTSSSIVSSVVFGPISEQVLCVWSQLPEAIRLDPSLAAIQREYERMSHNAVISRSLNLPEGETLVVNMSVSPENRVTADDDKNLDDHVHGHHPTPKSLYRYTKIVLLLCCWITFTIILMFKSDHISVTHQISIPGNQIRTIIQGYMLVQDSTSNRVSVSIEGSFLPSLDGKSEANLSTHHLTFWLGLIDDGQYDNSSDNIHRNLDDYSQNISEPWRIPIVPEDLANVLPEQKYEKIFDLKNLKAASNNGPRRSLAVNIRTNMPSSFPVSIGYDFSPINTEDGVIYASIILLGLYILIIFEIVHRALATMLASTMSLAILAALNERPTMAELISWIDVDTILLIFSMMILVGVFAETGVFDYMAVYAYKITGGKLWPLINTLCIFTAVMSSFLDNVTVVLLMTPVTIRLCEVMELNPIPILTAMVVYSNIGGAATPVGDLPNVIIVSNRDVINDGVSFCTFVLHMGVGVAIVLLVVYAQLRFMFRDVAVFGSDQPQHGLEMKHGMANRQLAASSLSSYNNKEENSMGESFMTKVERLLSMSTSKLMTVSVSVDTYRTTLEELEEKYPIRCKWLLVKCIVAFLFVVALFFLHNLPQLNLSLGWTALLGVLLLLVLADSQDIDSLLGRVEWSTLLFFASLFVLMEALARLGLIAWIGKLTEKVILSVNEESRLAVAILLILWVSAFASALVDNVPLATMMVRIAGNLSQNSELGLPLQPLIWALAFGACMGGNATLIGATANMVCAGVAQQHGYRFTFMQFFKVGFPIMLTSTATVTVYLMIAHVIFNWV